MLTSSHLNKIEAGIKQPGISTFQRIMEILNAEIKICNENRIEKEKHISRMCDILMGKSAIEVKFVLKILQSIVDNLDKICAYRTIPV